MPLFFGNTCTKYSVERYNTNMDSMVHYYSIILAMAYKYEIFLEIT